MRLHTEVGAQSSATRHDNAAARAIRQKFSQLFGIACRIENNEKAQVGRRRSELLASSARPGLWPAP